MLHRNDRQGADSSDGWQIMSSAAVGGVSPTEDQPCGTCCSRGRSSCSAAASSTPFLDGIDLLRLSHPGVPDVDELERDLEPAHRVADGRGAGAGPGRHILRDAARARLPGRQFHPRARPARLSRSAGLLPRPVRPHSDARAPRLRGDGEHVGELGSAAIAAGQGPRAARLYWHSVEFGLARGAGELKILGAVLASSFGEAHLARERRVERSPFSVEPGGDTTYKHDAFQPRYLGLGLRSRRRSPQVLALSPRSSLLALESGPRRPV